MTLEKAIEGLSLPDRARLKFAFEQGTVAFAKVHRDPKLYVGVFLEQLPWIEQLEVLGKWSLGRRRESSG